MDFCRGVQLARGFLAGNRKAKGEGETSRAKTDDYAHKMCYQESDFAVVDRVSEVAAKRRRAERRGCAGVVVDATGHHRPQLLGASKPHHISDAVASR